MPNSNFGALVITDGYTLPGQQLLPNSVEAWNQFVAGVQTTGVRKSEFIAGTSGTIADVRAYLETAPTVSTFIVDVMKNGVTMFTTSANRPIVGIGANASSTILPDILTFVAGDRIRFDIIQIGSGVAGSDLALTITYKTPNLA